jgi:Na+/H+-dicarboxylate symporter
MLIIVLLFGDNIPLAAKSNLYSLSLFLKDVIICVLPVLIFSLVWTGILNLKGESVKIVLILIPLVCVSNFLGMWVSYIFTAPILDSGVITISELVQNNALSPAWKLPIPRFVSNDVALVFGFILGLSGNFIRIPILDIISRKLLRVTNFILKRVIYSVLPLFILGFIIKMQHEDSLLMIIKDYSKLLVIVAILAYGYMFSVMHFLLCGRKIRTTIEKFKNLIPSILIGFFSMSSAAAIPSTIGGTKKNLKNNDLAGFIIPAAANMHLLGDCFALPIIGLSIMISFGFGLPDISQYFIFTIYGVIAKFAAAGIPGGSALIFAPLFENVFEFSAPMLTAVTAIYILFDPVATSANVFGHGMFALLFEKVHGWVCWEKKRQNSKT